MNNIHGATVEVGKVKDGAFRVESYNRPSVITPPLKPLQRWPVILPGDEVYFFCLDSGEGYIICTTNYTGFADWERYLELEAKVNAQAAQIASLQARVAALGG